MLIPLLLLAPAIMAAPVTVSEPQECFTKVYAFDSETITEKRFRELLPLSPFHAGDWDPVPGIDLCVELLDVHKKPCGSRKPDAENFLANAEVNIAEAKARLPKLRAIKAPAALRPAQDFLLAAVTFGAWMNESKRDYLKTGSAAALMRPWRAIAPARACAGAFEKLAAKRDLLERWDVVHYDWHNCVNEEFRKSFEYPNGAWEKFLAENKVSQKEEGEESCD